MNWKMGMAAAAFVAVAVVGVTAADAAPACGVRIQCAAPESSEGVFDKRSKTDTDAAPACGVRIQCAAPLQQP